MKREQKEKGITLVALVITIIILLILAGITITLTLGDKGIINMAKQAKNDYENAADYEQELLGNVVNEANMIINSNEIQNESLNMSKIRILEQGTIDTGTMAGDYMAKLLTINLQNTYTEEDKARVIIYSVEVLSGTFAPYSSDYCSSVYVRGDKHAFYTRNCAGPSKSGNARLYYWVIGGLEGSERPG